MIPSPSIASAISDAAATSMAATSALRSPSDSFGVLKAFTNEITLPQQEPPRGELRPGVAFHKDHLSSVRQQIDDVLGLQGFLAEVGDDGVATNQQDEFRPFGECRTANHHADIPVRRFASHRADIGGE